MSLTITLFLGLAVYAQETPETNDWERFERAGMISEADMDHRYEDIRPDGIGFTPEKASVPLFFDLDGNLLSAERYNSLADKGELEQNILDVMYTDFTTFREVMEERFSLGLITQETLDTVDLKYVSGLPGHQVEGVENPAALESDALGTTIYLYDPYSTSYQTYEEFEEWIDQQLEEQDLSEPSPALDDVPDPLADPPSDD